MGSDKFFQLLFGAFFDYAIIARPELTGSTRYGNDNQSSCLLILNKLYELSFSALICSIALFYGDFFIIETGQIYIQVLPRIFVFLLHIIYLFVLHM